MLLSAMFPLILFYLANLRGELYPQSFLTVPYCCSKKQMDARQ
jgi:hypothetical protein